MASKKTTNAKKTTGETIIEHGHVRRTHRAEDLVPTSEADAVALEAAGGEVPFGDDDEAREEAAAEAALVADQQAQAAEEEAEEASPESGEQPAAPGEPEDPAAASKRKAWATLALRRAVLKIGKYNYAEWDVNGIPGALAVIKAALAKMEPAKVRRGAPKLAQGVVVRIRDKSKAHFAGALEDDELVGIKVLSVNGKFARCQLPGGGTVVIESKHVEVTL